MTRANEKKRINTPHIVNKKSKYSSTECTANFPSYSH